MQILVDGYNLLKVLYPWESADDRENLLSLLEAYRKRKRQCRITVVFDGWMTGRLADSEEKAAGIRVIYTGRDRTADDRIKALVRTLGNGCIVVSSDRSVSAAAVSCGAAGIPSEEFAARLMGETDERPEEGDLSRKKGNPRKAPKKERKRMTALKKL